MTFFQSRLHAQLGAKLELMTLRYDLNWDQELGLLTNGATQAHLLLIFNYYLSLLMYLLLIILTASVIAFCNQTFLRPHFACELWTPALISKWQEVLRQFRNSGRTKASGHDVQSYAEWCWLAGGLWPELAHRYCLAYSCFFIFVFEVFFIFIFVFKFSVSCQHLRDFR